MSAQWMTTVKGRLRTGLYAALGTNRAVYECPICSYEGPFRNKPVNRKPGTERADSKCTRCGSKERHRLLSLVFDSILNDEHIEDRKLLHFAPEECLVPILSQFAGTYHTTDLFMEGVDFTEDIHDLSFSDASYDCVVISRVMTAIPDYRKAIGELRRITSPGGMLIISEAYIRDDTFDFEQQQGEFFREIGTDLLTLLQQHFTRVDYHLPDAYPERYQMVNRILVDKSVYDSYPPLVRAEGVGYKELVAVCHV